MADTYVDHQAACNECGDGFTSDMAIEAVEWAESHECATAVS